MASRGAPLYLDNDDQPEYYLERKNSNTGALEPATGLTGLPVWLSLTEGGQAIHPTVSKILTERSANPGWYYAQYQGSDLRAHIAAYAGQDIYEMAGNGADFTCWCARYVNALRPVGV